MIGEEAKTALRNLMASREKRDELKKALENAEREFRDNEAEAYERLSESSVVGTLKVDLGEPWGVVSFRNRETYYGRVIDEDAALAYFEQRAMLDEVTTPKFAKARLNEIVRDAVEQGEQPPPGVDHYANRGVTITRQK